MSNDDATEVVKISCGCLAMIVGTSLAIALGGTITYFCAKLFVTAVDQVLR